VVAAAAAAAGSQQTFESNRQTAGLNSPAVCF
jgi:hypothetical protein